MLKETIEQLSQNGENIASRRIKYLLNKVDLNSVRTILDIGSWHLKQTIEMAIIFPNAAIHAFEPNPDTYAVCKSTWQNLPEGMRNRIFIHQVALSDKVGKVDFYPLDKSKTSSSNEGIASLNPLKAEMDGSLLGDKWVQKKISVESNTLDNWCNMNGVRKVDLIWMDVQGAELSVLSQGKETLRDVKALCTEAGLIPYYENHTLKEDMDKFLQDNNFTELQEAFCKTTWSSEKAAEADVIYLNKDFIL
jgi:FkbM family methyltransferase